MKLILALVLLAALITISAQGSEGPLTIVDANEILTKVKAGKPVEYDNVTIKGDLTLDRLGLPVIHTYRNGKHEDATLVCSPIAITNSVINERAYFNNMIFNKTIDFSGSQFNNDAYFYGSQFIGIANFDDVQFNQGVDFCPSQFNDFASFSNAQFSSTANFDYSQFEKTARFKDSQFSSLAKFEVTRFNDDVYFENSNFNNAAKFCGSRFSGNYSIFIASNFNLTADFNGSQFNSNVNFLSSKFNRNAHFADSEFSNEACFKDSQFNSTADFKRAQFYGIANFENSTFNSTISFLDAEFNKIANFNKIKVNGSAIFYNSIFNRPAYMEDSHLNKINLTKSDYTRLYLPWDSIAKGGLDFEEAAYITLIKNYDNLAWYDDSNDCYYDYRSVCRENQNWSPVKCKDFVEYVAYGYGVRPLFPIVWSVAIVIIFGIPFLFRRDFLLKFTRDDPSQDLKQVETKIYDPFLFSLSAFIPFLLQSTEYKVQRYKCIAIGLRFLGPALIALILAAFTKTYLIR